jgi:pimeloyl-ACP methyl ester carboxylesterase
MLLTFLEQRAVGEVGAFLAATPFLRMVGRGDRHPVLVLPGFTASDRSTEMLRWYLRSLGYWTHGWQLGRNYGPNRHIVSGLATRLAELHERHGRRVTLVGQSLGGMYARHMARRAPDMVRAVITMGSRPQVRRLVSDEEEMPLEVPSTAIYSRTDGIVNWRLCIESAGPLRESIEVRSSHSGMAVNPSTLYAVADRLAQPEGEWKPFRPPISLRALYPPAATYHRAA